MPTEPQDKSLKLNTPSQGKRDDEHEIKARLVDRGCGIKDEHEPTWERDREYCGIEVPHGPQAQRDA